MGSPVAHLGRIGVTPYDVVRIILGLILLTAAALKGHQLATEPVAETGLLTSRWFLMGVIEFELFFGLWLFSGLYPRQTWQAALTCFAVFACVSVYKAASGEAPCGCFGRVPVNPWYTFILDVAAMVALLSCRPARSGEVSPRPLAGDAPGVRARPRGRLPWVFGIFLAAGMPAAVSMGTYQAATLDEAGDIFGNSDFVVLEPENWIGKRFPLLAYIDIGDQLAHGEWIVVFHRHECAQCQEPVLEYEGLTRPGGDCSGRVRVAGVEVPPYGKPAHSSGSSDALWVAGRLSDVKEWFFVTPLIVALDQGQVAAVRHGKAGTDLIGGVAGVYDEL